MRAVSGKRDSFGVLFEVKYFPEGERDEVLAVGHIESAISYECLPLSKIDISPCVIGLYKQVKSEQIFPFRQFDGGNGLVSILSGISFLFQVSPAIGDYIAFISLFSNTFYFDV